MKKSYLRLAAQLVLNGLRFQLMKRQNKPGTFQALFSTRYTSTQNTFTLHIKYVWEQTVLDIQKEKCGGTFRSVKDFVDQYNKNAEPFMWTATADSILLRSKDL